MYEVLNNEIDLIQNEDYRSFVRYYLDEYCPKYFYTIGASSSGKYHPQFSQGEGGLVRHTKAVVMFAKELLNMSTYGYLKDEYKDYVIMACIMHDTCKYGKTAYDKNEYMAHARNASWNVAECWADFFEGQTAPPMLLMAIRSHMGQWSDVEDDRPMTTLDRCVHLADYMASRNFIDIPSLHEEQPIVHEEFVVRKEIEYGFVLG